MSIDFKAHHVRAPEKAKSDNWQETADRWLCSINGVEFDYYTGIGHRIKGGSSGSSRTSSGYTYEELKRKALTDMGVKQFCAVSRPVAPALDDMLECLLSDASAAEMSFEDWADDLGYNTDSIKALETYHECQKTAGKLRKAKINIEAERKRLQDRE